MPSDAEILNALANQPDVLAAMALGYDAVDLSAFLRWPGNVMLGDEHGAALFAELGGGMYDGHFMFPAATRPKRIIDTCRGFLDVMFTTHHASRIVGAVLADNRRARAMTRALGFTPLGRSVSETGRSCVLYTLERAQWATS